MQVSAVVLQSRRSSAEIGKWVRIPRGPAAVIEEFCHMATGKPGRRGRAMMLKPEDLPVFLLM